MTTQSKLEAALAGGVLPPELGATPTPTVVMIQCVESRNDEHPYCSRVCCSEAVKNALEIKSRLPGARVVVLGRDIRTPAPPAKLSPCSQATRPRLSGNCS